MHSEALQRYLAMQAGMQSPQQYHAWLLLSASAAVAAKRVWFQRGAITTYPNMMIFLVGGAGARKSTAMDMHSVLTGHIPHIKYAPHSTAGFPQGLISAMIGNTTDGDTDEEVVAATQSFLSEMEGEPVSGIPLTKRVEAERPGEEHALWAVLEEMMIFFGINNLNFAGFLCGLYDGRAINHRLKSENLWLRNPCFNLIGAATPTNIATIFPENALEQGILSRTIFVWGERRGENYWPDEINPEDYTYFQQAMSNISDMKGAFTYDAEVRECYNDWAQIKPDIDDIRFSKYTERRDGHMLKAAMNIAMLDGRMNLQITDLADANELLQQAEKQMPECLGEFGMSQDIVARRRIMAVMQEETKPLPIGILQAKVGRDVGAKFVTAGLFDLIRAGLIRGVKSKDSEGAPLTCFVRIRDRDSKELVVDLADYKDHTHVLPATEADKRGVRDLRKFAKESAATRDESDTSSPTAEASGETLLEALARKKRDRAGS